MKRRRAQLAREAAQTQPEAANEENQQPDLTELSNDLPSGWQVQIFFIGENGNFVYFIIFSELEFVLIW